MNQQGSGLDERTDKTATVFLSWVQKEGRQITPDGRVGEAVAADLVGSAAATLRNLRSQGLGPTYHRTGGRITYRVIDLARWVECGRQITFDELEGILK